MNWTDLHITSAPRWMHRTLLWACVLAVSIGLAYVLNTAAVTALSTHLRSDASASGDVGALCALDADGALYARWDGWLPAGRSAFCRQEAYPGVSARAEMATQLARAGRLVATITFAAPGNIRVDLYCGMSTQQRQSDALFVSEAEARHLYAQVCAPAGASDE